MKAFKVFNPDWTCKDYQFEVGNTYSIDSPIVLCENGFHFCRILSNCFNYYSFNINNKVAEVEILGDIIGDPFDKECTNIIKIVKELSWNDVLLLVNSGYSNSGNRNSGHSNSGNSNSGNRNSGNRNSGHSNSGHWNSGDWNSGHWNSGHWNSGDWNSGLWNSGDWNSGHFNTIAQENIFVFNKICKKIDWDNIEKPKFIYNIILNEWIPFNYMLDVEKINNPQSENMGGYLKIYNYKDAWKTSYNNASKEDIELLKLLPNFDKDIFFEITGILID